MLAICIGLSSLVDNSLGLLFLLLSLLLVFVFVFLLFFLFLKSFFQLAFWSYLPLMRYYSNSLVIIVEKEMKRNTAFCITLFYSCCTFSPSFSSTTSSPAAFLTVTFSVINCSLIVLVSLTGFFFITISSFT